MRVCLYSWETLHSIAIGGVAAHVSELAEALAKREHDVHVYTRRRHDQDRYSCVSGVHYHRCDFETHEDFPTEINNMCNSFAWHMGETAGMIGGFDVAHAHDWLAAKALVQARNHHNCAGVFTIHSTEYGRCGNHIYDGRSRMIRDFEWEGAYCADRVVAVSGVLRDEFTKLNDLPAEKVTSIYNGVHPDRFATAIDVGAAKEALGIGSYDPTVLFCGRLAWQKAPDLLIEAVPAVLTQHPGAKFIMAGDGEMRHGLEQRVNELGISHAMRFLGYRRGQELADLFKTADLVCVPSRNEPFGIVILEAWSAGKPVVAAQNGGPAEFVNHLEDGIKIEDKIDSITWGLLEGFRDFKRLRAMGAAGQGRIASEFNWDRIAEQTEAVYQQAIASNHARLGTTPATELHVAAKPKPVRARRRKPSKPRRTRKTREAA